MNRPLTRWLWVGCLGVRLEFKPADLWVGVFWRREPPLPSELHVWVCLLPMLPIHAAWSPGRHARGKREEASRAGR